VIAPGSFLLPCQNRPGHRNAGSAVDHTDRQHHEPLTQGGSIHSQGHGRPGPQSYNPTQQRHKTSGHIQVTALLAAFVFGIAAPFLQSLFNGVLVLAQQQGQEGGHSAATTRAGEGYAEAKHGQDHHLRLGQVRHAI